MAGFFTSIADSAVTPLINRLLNSIATGSEEEGIAKAERAVMLIIRCVPRLHKTALRNLELVFPELTSPEREALARRSYRVLAKNIYWFAKLPQLSPEEMRALFDFSQAEPIWREAERSEVGTLMITAHFGMFELFAQGQTMHGGPFHILIREFGFPKLDRLWTARRERFGSTLFSRKGAFGELIKGLKEGRNMALLFDQNVKPNHAAFIDLFGMPAATTKAIGYAALKTSCPVVFGVCMENPPGSKFRFRVIGRAIPNPNTEEGTTDEKIAKFLRRLHEVLEELIRLEPEAWYWIHRRWKTRPNGDNEHFYG